MPTPPPTAGEPTAERLLDAAEQLFAQRGTSVSVREITAAADANLASVSYHFGSKDGLLQALLRRRLDPINEARLALLDRFEAAVPPGAAVPLERIVEAFVRPALDPAANPGPHFMQIMAHLHASHEPVAAEFFREVFEPLVDRFLTSFSAALPDLPPARLHLRMHLLVGATVHALMAQHSPKCPLPKDLASPLDPTDVLDELVEFCAAGFRHG
ncbi:MAG: TetR family transcriptional regulator [Planctomycetota bacterium]|nr:TetR family transcriptional regulator [Planctomycetota bacterium]